MWVRVDTLTPLARIIGLAARPGSESIALALGTTPSALLLEHIASANLTRVMSSPGVIGTGVWTHLCVTIDGAGNASIFKNGAMIQQGRVDPPGTTARSIIILGKGANPQDPTLRAAVTELRIWNRVRQASEIQACMRAEFVRNEPDLLGYYKLNDGAPSKIARNSGGPVLDDGILRGGCSWLNSGPGIQVPAAAAAAALREAELAAAQAQAQALTASDEAQRLAQIADQEEAAFQVCSAAAQQQLPALLVALEEARGLATQLAAAQLAAQLAAPQQAVQQQAASQPAAPQGNVLRMDQRLAPGGSLRSPNGRYVFRFQEDGNLVLYRQDNSVVWASNTNGRPPGHLRMQDDGNLVAYGPGGEVVWAANNYGGKWGQQYRDSQFIVQDDGSLVVYASNGEVVWAARCGP